MIGETNATQDIKFLKFVDYIESSGTQYIDTGVKPSLTIREDVEFAFTVLDKETGRLCGAANNDGVKFYFATNAAGNFVSGVISSGWENAVIGTADTNKHIISLGNGSQKFDGVEYATQKLTDLKINEKTLFLFAYNSDWGGVFGHCSMKIYSCKIYDNDVLVRDFKPCVDKNGIYCMYDLVERKFYYSQGTDDFRGKGWQPTYIESTGTQYIDTEFMPTPNTKIELELLMSGSFKDTATYGGNSAIFGVYDDTSVFAANFGGSANQYNQLFVWNDKTSSDGGTIISLKGLDGVITTKNKFTLDTDNVSWGNVSSQLNAKTTTHASSLIIFGRKLNGTVGSLTAYNMRLFSCRIYESDVLVREFVPKIDDEDVVCLYDKITKSYFYNAGTGSFIAG